MSKRAVIITLAILAAVLNTVPRYLNFEPPYDCERYLDNYKLYTLGNSLSFTLIILVAIGRKRCDEIVEIVLTALFWLSVNDTMDELFFDPYTLGFNEVIFSLIILLHAVYQYRQYKQRKKIDTD